jgi:purine-binding chemotaxis protein CheW
MSQTANAHVDVNRDQLHLATFYVSDLCLALEIDQIQEIIRNINVTQVPQSPAEVRGVINLRGEVTTVVDLCCVLGLPSAELQTDKRTLIVRSQGESIGLIVDRVGDITAVDAQSLMPSPPNVGTIDGKFFRGVCPRESEIIVVLDLDQALTSPSSLGAHAA